MSRSKVNWKWATTFGLLTLLVVLGGLAALLASFSDMANDYAERCEPASLSVVGPRDVNLRGGSAADRFFASYDQQLGKEDNEQRKNAELIIGIGHERKATDYDIKLALAVAMHESNMINLSYGDRDSLGLYQQRPSVTGGDGKPYWGTREQIMDPVFSINRFYQELSILPERSKYPLIESAIRIQNPDPAAYYSHWPTGQWDVVAEELLEGSSSTDKKGQSAPVIDEDCNDPRTNILKAVKAAHSQIGKPYRWGGSDGAGLTRWAYGKADVQLPRSAVKQYEDGTKVDKTDIQLGDLVYWAKQKDDPETIYRVGMWLGSGQVIEATGSNALIETTDMRWSDFAGATRPVTEVETVSADQPISGDWTAPVESSKYTYLSKFGMRHDPLGRGLLLHNGADMAAPGGTPIYAVADGTVSVTRFETGMGGVVTYIDHGGGIHSGYAHQQRRKDGLAVGSEVKVGEVIGYVGSTGGSSGDHLHFMITRSPNDEKAFIDPVEFMKGKGVKLNPYTGM